MSNQTDLRKINIFPQNWFGGRLNKPGSKLKLIAMIWLIFGILPFAVLSTTAWLDSDALNMAEKLPETGDVTLPECIEVSLAETSPETITVIPKDNTMNVTPLYIIQYESLSKDNKRKLMENLQGTIMFIIPHNLKVSLLETKPETAIIALPDTLCLTLPETFPETQRVTLTVGLPDTMEVKLLDPLPENPPDTLILTLPDSLRVTLSKNNKLGLLEDKIMLSYFIFIPLSLMAAMLIFPAFPAVTQIFRQVTMEYPSRRTTVSKDNKAINEGAKFLNPLISTKRLNQLLKNCEGMIRGKGNARYILAVCFIGGLAWVATQARIHWIIDYPYLLDLWSSQNHVWAFVVRTIYEFIVFGVIFPWFFFIYIMILHSIRYICVELNKQDALKIRPLSPDKAGGLGALGAFSFKMILVILPMVIPLVLYPVFGAPNVLLRVGLIMYIPAVCFSFLYPLSGAHNAMAKFKRQELSALSREFNRVYDEFVRDTKSKQLEDIPRDMVLMEKLDQLYQKAESMPVWPFNLATLSKLLVFTIPVGIPILIDFIKALLG
jgi:hypothetical protein